MNILLHIITMSVLAVPVTAQSSTCRPTFDFYHIPHGAVSAWIDQPVLDGSYKPIYEIRKHLVRLQRKPTIAITFKTHVLYMLQSECYGASPKGGTSVTLVEGKTNKTQVIKYPMGSNGRPFTFISPRREQLIIECVDPLLFAFNILLKNSSEVVARIRNIRIRHESANDTFTVEVHSGYKDIRVFLIALSLAMDKYMYPESIKEKRKYCN
ncbi:hypothetical protein I4U23_027038 [Adineta vaga]|nr:hypothetical protein I4U23_027038 [Adineta vaga]